jgi:BolA protein
MMQPDQRIAQIRSLLASSLAPLECEVEDESALHAGHAGAASGGGHYRLRLVSSRFEGQPRVARHRLVYDALHDMMQNDIHALAITALTPAEAGAAP